MSSVTSFHPVGVGVVGLGRAGTYHLERISLRDDCRVVTAFDTSPDAKHKATALIPRFAEDYESLLCDEGVELVLVATPPASHVALTIEALAAGRHVLVETPLCLDLPEADAIVAAARQASRSVIVAQTRRWDDDFRTALRSVRDGTLGPLKSLKHINWQFALPASGGRQPPEASPAQYPPDWRAAVTTGGGALWELGTHDFDQLLQLARERPATIYAELYAGGPASSADDGFLAIVRFPSGLIAHLEVNRASPGCLQTGWVVAGAAGTYLNGTHYSATSDGEVVDVPIETSASEVEEFYAAVVRHVRGDGPNPFPADEARSTIALINAARQSARTGSPVAVHS